MNFKTLFDSANQPLFEALVI